MWDNLILAARGKDLRWGGGGIRLLVRISMVWFSRMETSELTDRILKACYQVHNELGIGFSEKVYERALKIALVELGLKAECQVPIEVRFRGQVVGEFFADVLVENSVIVELKAVKSLLPEHQAQLINYLKATNLETGLLINFAIKGLEIKRSKLAH